MQKRTSTGAISCPTAEAGFGANLAAHELAAWAYWCPAAIDARTERGLAARVPPSAAQHCIQPPSVSADTRVCSNLLVLKMLITQWPACAPRFRHDRQLHSY